MMPTNVCDAHEPPRSTYYGREIDRTTAGRPVRDDPPGRLRLVQPRRQFERIAACSSAVSGAARAEAREMSSPNPCHRPVVKERLEKLQLIDRQKAVVHLGSAAMAQSLM